MSQVNNLSSDNLEGIAELIKSGKCKKISFLVGAGISVSAGIPDFRSKDGFYNTLNLSNYSLTQSEKNKIFFDPQYLLSIQLFSKNPVPYIQARREFLISPEKYKPTITHYFMKLLHSKNLLKRIYSTNIDGLDVRLNLPNDVLINAHGTLGKAKCYKCDIPYDMNEFRQEIIKEAFPIRCKQCDEKNNWIKPCTILFGEQLPSEYHEYSSKKGEWDDVDLLIIAGTSLQVGPSNELPSVAKHKNKNIIRLLVNRDFVKSHDYKWNEENSNDIFFQGNCDDAFLSLAKMLNWDQELLALAKSESDNNQNVNNNDNNNYNNNNNDNNNDNLKNIDNKNKDDNNDNIDKNDGNEKKIDEEK